MKKRNPASIGGSLENFHLKQSVGTIHQLLLYCAAGLRDLALLEGPSLHVPGPGLCCIHGMGSLQLSFVLYIHAGGELKG